MKQRNTRNTRKKRASGFGSLSSRGNPPGKTRYPAFSRSHAPAWECIRIFFRAKEQDAFLPHNPELVWIDLALEGTEVHIVPGNHISMNEQPHVRFLAKRLKICLEKTKADYVK
ncbi:MAG: hypothetical protein GY862_10875 [Gammaproteobacteria bacterium]|nr:hypothetical protein [Gammaproteobacteria bacterium]